MGVKSPGIQRVYLSYEVGIRDLSSYGVAKMIMEHMEILKNKTKFPSDGPFFHQSEEKIRFRWYEDIDLTRPH